ncbi:MAG: alpha/beta hydrolase family protein [Pseudomonadota bacterium]
MPIRAALLALALLTLPAGAGDLRQDLSIESAALGRPLPYSLYLPDAAADPTRRFPVVYLLHGYNGGQYEWARGGRIEAMLDAMIAAGEIPPLIVVMPEAGTSWYVDSAQFGGQGDYETAITEDLVAAIDAAWPTRPTAHHRAIAGNSMGGHGALRLAMLRPDVFVATAGLSPAIWRPGGVSALSGPGARDAASRERWYPKTTGETFELAVFNLQSPFALVERAAAAKPPPAILLAVGDDDFFGLYDGTVELYIDLRRAGLKPELRVGDGGHDWDYWRGAAAEAFRFFATHFRNSE